MILGIIYERKVAGISSHQNLFHRVQYGKNSRTQASVSWVGQREFLEKSEQASKEKEICNVSVNRRLENTGFFSMHICTIFQKLVGPQFCVQLRGRILWKSRNSRPTSRRGHKALELTNIISSMQPARLGINNATGCLILQQCSQDGQTFICTEMFTYSEQLVKWDDILNSYVYNKDAHYHDFALSKDYLNQNLYYLGWYLYY